MATTDEKLDGISKHLESLHVKHDATNQKMDALDGKHDALAKRLDAVEQRVKGDDEERAEKERADAAKRRADAAADASHESRAKFADAQMRLDSAIQAWGSQCRAPLAGETLRNYRISILDSLKAHSPAYKDSDLGTIGDENAFSNIEGIIINDAIKASMVTGVPGMPLRESTKTENGRTVRTFHGDPMVCWAPFMGGQIRVGRLVRYPNS